MPNEQLRIERDGDLAIVWIDQAGARVNTLSSATLAAFSDALDEAEWDERVRAVVFISGKTDAFIAGADLDLLRSLDEPAEARVLSHEGHVLIRRMRALPKPTVAAIHGAAMGGGLEVALACTYRIATDHKKTKLALPEVKLGLLPGGGGTQLLPRLVGLQGALEMMLTGKNTYPRKARRMGLVDALTYKDGLLDAARQAARALADGTLAPDRRHDLTDRLLESTAVSRRIVYEQARSRTLKETHGNYPAPLKIIDCVKAGLEHGLEAGFEAEAEGFGELVFTPESRALVSLFFAKQAAEKNPWAEQARRVERLGVLGGGLMGGGIAEVSVDNGLEVVLKDVNLGLAAQARKHVWKAMTQKVKKRILSPFERDVRVERLTPVADYDALAPVDLVIEAVPEKLDLKRQVVQDVEAVTREDCIFATNTSSIPIAEIAEASERPETVLGMHYFSPVAQMPLLEIIKTEKTAGWALATAYATGLRQGKTVIVVNDGPGFYTTRILGVYMNEALLLLEEGAAMPEVDAIMKRFGFPIGPYELFDLVGIDVAAKVTEVMGRYLAGRALHLSDSAARLADAGYVGQKTRKGFYHYEQDGRGRLKKGDVNETVYAFFGGAKRKSFDEEAVQQRLGLLMVNEAVRCLEEGILRAAPDGDLGAVFGLGFPPFTGGPFRYIDRETTPAVAARLGRLRLQHGDRFEPAGLLQEKARTGARFHEVENRGAGESKSRG